MNQSRAVQIVEHVSNTQFNAKKKELREIYGDKRVADLPLVVLCIAGAARKGKSFMLNFFLDYLIHKEKHPNEPWQINDDTRLAGFEFREGEDRTTLGIWAWSHIFVIEQEDGKKVAVSLVDSQGTFDNNTTYKDCSTIFAMTCMFSSVMCFNVFTDLQEDKLNDLSAFIDHAKKIVDNLGGSGKLFQDLVFIIRDFCFQKYLDDEKGGQMYIEKVLGDVKIEQLQQLRDGLNASYERKFGFVFPHPGEIVALAKTSEISEMNPKFVYRAKDMVETLLSQSELQVKRVGPTTMYCKNMSDYISTVVKCFNENHEFAPQDVQAVNREFMINLEVRRACQSYDILMDKAFVQCKSEFSEDELVALHEKMLEQIEDDMLERIINEAVVTDVLHRSIDQIKSIFFKYMEKNQLLVESEKVLLQLIEEKRQLEKLAKLKFEADEKLAREKKEYEIRQAELLDRQERERLQYEKEQAEIAAKLETEKSAHEFIQTELYLQHEAEREKQKSEAERQRNIEQLKHEEEIREIHRRNEERIAEEKRQHDEKVAKLKFEADEKLAREKKKYEIRQAELLDRQERERLQYEKEQAEIAAKLEAEKSAHEFIQTELCLQHEAEREKQKSEAERQRNIEQLKHEEEIREIHRRNEERIAEEKRQHDEKVAKLKFEADEKLAREKKKYEIRQAELLDRQERERLQYEKEQAEIAAKLEAEKSAHEFIQTELCLQHEAEREKQKLEAERQRNFEQSKHEEEIREIHRRNEERNAEEKRQHDEKLAKLKLEADEKLAREKKKYEIRQAELLDRQERERLQYEKEQAEIAAKLEAEKSAHEFIQTELYLQHEAEREKQKSEAERQRNFEQLKHEEEMRRIHRRNEEEKRQLELRMKSLAADNEQKIAEAVAEATKQRKKNKKGFFGSNFIFFSPFILLVIYLYFVGAIIPSSVYLRLHHDALPPQ